MECDSRNKLLDRNKNCVTGDLSPYLDLIARKLSSLYTLQLGIQSHEYISDWFGGDSIQTSGCHNLNSLAVHRCREPSR